MRTPHPRNWVFQRPVRKTRIPRIAFADGAYQSLSWPPLSGSFCLDKAEVTGSSPVSPTSRLQAKRARSLSTRSVLSQSCRNRDPLAGCANRLIGRCARRVLELAQHARVVACQRRDRPASEQVRDYARRRPLSVGYSLEPLAPTALPLRGCVYAPHPRHTPT